MDKNHRRKLAERLNASRMPGPGQPKGLSYRELAERITRATGGVVELTVLYKFLADPDREPSERTLYVLEGYARTLPTKRRGAKRTKAA